MRTFYNKWFSKWLKKSLLTEASLHQAIQDLSMFTDDQFALLVRAGEMVEFSEPPEKKSKRL